MSQQPNARAGDAQQGVGAAERPGTNLPKVPFVLARAANTNAFFLLRRAIEMRTARCLGLENPSGICTKSDMAPILHLRNEDRQLSWEVVVWGSLVTMAVCVFSHQAAARGARRAE